MPCASSTALGAQLSTNVLGSALDDARFEPLLGRLEEAGRAVWLHPTHSAAWADYPAKSRSDFGLWWSLGWPYETAAALSRLVYSGHMERHPRKLVIAHHGGGLVPHFSARLAMGPGSWQVKDRLPRPPLNYFRRFHVDTARIARATRGALCPRVLRQSMTYHCAPGEIELLLPLLIHNSLVSTVECQKV